MMAKRKFSISILTVCLLVIVNVMCGCNIFPVENNSASRYKLTVQDPNGYLIENLQDTYKAGEGVTVKTKMLSDVVLEAYLDGVLLPLPTQKYLGEEGHWEFYFKMPSHDAVLSFSLSDGWITDGIDLGITTQIEIVTDFYNTYKDKNPTLPFEQISLRCYGDFDGVYVLFVDGVWDSVGAVTSEVIADVKFIYVDGNSMTVYYDHVFYTLSEAYENNILSYDNLLTTQETYKASYEFLYGED